MPAEFLVAPTLPAPVPGPCAPVPGPCAPVARVEHLRLAYLPEGELIERVLVDGPEGWAQAYQAAFGLPARGFPGYLVAYEVRWTNGARVRGCCHLGFRDHELSFPVGYALEELARPGCAAYTTTTPEQRAAAQRILRECDLPRWRENYSVMRRLHPDLPALF